jgi:hypothetical protein
MSLIWTLTKKVRVSIPKYPIFNNINASRICALLAVGLECNVLVGGINGVTFAVLYKHLHHLKPNRQYGNLYNLIINYYISVNDQHSIFNNDSVNLC